jgi:hypothetical protein
VSEPKDRTSVPSLDDLDAGWGDEEDEKDDEEKADLVEAAPEEPDEPVVVEPEPPGLTAEQREARLAALNEKKERARAKGAAKKERRKERRKARALAASAKKKTKQKRRVPEPERSAPSLRGVTRDTSDAALDAEPDQDEAVERRVERSRPGRSAVTTSRGQRRAKGPNWQTLGAVALLVAMLGAVAVFFLRR